MAKWQQLGASMRTDSCAGALFQLFTLFLRHLVGTVRFRVCRFRIADLFRAVHKLFQNCRPIFFDVRAIYLISYVKGNYAHVARNDAIFAWAKLNAFRSFPIEFWTTWSSGCRLSGWDAVWRLRERPRDTAGAFREIRRGFGEALCDFSVWCIFDQIRYARLGAGAFFLA